MVIGTIVFAIAFGFIGFIIGLRHYSDSEFEDSLKAFKSFVDTTKDQGVQDPQDTHKNKVGSELLIGTLSMNISQRINKIKNGAELKRKIESGNQEELDDVEEEINKQEAEYKENLGKKWIIALVLLIIGAILGYFAMPYLFKMTKSEYNRDGI